MIRPGDRHLALAEASLAADPAIVRGVEFIEQFMSVNERCLLRELLRQAWLVGRQSVLLERLANSPPVESGTRLSPDELDRFRCQWKKAYGSGRPVVLRALDPAPRPSWRFIRSVWRAVRAAVLPRR